MKKPEELKSLSSEDMRNSNAVVYATRLAQEMNKLIRAHNELLKYVLELEKSNETNKNQDN